ncbi:hypothetical protein SCHPADRAFT_995937 [Schizopora paradoxa]|uniref:F-box domain-containing protein n=1 Tax=Schizopora paradoxa TaxID=27342 RepID=A0A0H2RTI8_9AGAM|nr:hypothetical protein SCHPADRAFT_995937 [Schizopora paradoxa]
MNTNLDGESLETAMHNVISSWLVHNDPIPEAWKQTISPIDAMSSNEFLALDTSECRQLVSRSQSSLRRLQCLSDTFRVLSYFYAAKLSAAESNLYAVSNMWSLASLPSELLVRIFEFVVFGDRTLKNRWRAAVPLSHVCRYFRRTALSCPLLWSDVSGNAGMVSLSLSRSEDVPLDVTVAFDTVGSLLDKFLPEASTHSKRWRTLTLQVYCKDSEGVNHRDVEGTLSMFNICQIFGAVDAPSLESLSVINLSDFTLLEEKGSFSQWNTPNLRYLNTTLIPLSLRGLSNLTHLDFTVMMDQFHYNKFFKSVSQLKSIEDLALKLKISRAADHTSTQVFEKTTELCVRRLRVEVAIGSQSTTSFLRSLFSPLTFPNAVSLEVRFTGAVASIYTRYYDYGEEVEIEDGPMLLAAEETNCILHHDGQFPLVERFSLDVTGDVDIDRNPESWYDLQRGKIYLDVPINKLPNLKHLQMCCNGNLSPSFPGWVYGGPVADWTSAIRLPALETINIVIYCPGTAYGFAALIKEILHRQREQRKWETFRELSVTTVDRSAVPGRRTVSATYGGVAAQAWCARRLLITQGYYPSFASGTYVD